MEDTELLNDLLILPILEIEVDKVFWIAAILEMDWEYVLLIRPTLETLELKDFWILPTLEIELE